MFAPLSNNPDAVDGKDPTVAILDELASMPDDEMYSRFKTGMTLQKSFNPTCFNGRRQFK